MRQGTALQRKPRTPLLWPSVKDDIRHCLGVVEDLEAQIVRLCHDQFVQRVTITTLIHGCPGARVFLMQHLVGRSPLRLRVTKVANTIALGNQESRNSET